MPAPKGVEFKNATEKGKAAAVLTIFDAGTMTAKGRRDIARWIDKQKAMFLNHPHLLAKRFTCRYLYKWGA